MTVPIWYGYTTAYEVLPTKGTAVVFANSIPHRFRKIRNTTDSVQRRTFINFFIVDPSRKIPTKISFFTKRIVCLTLRRYFLLFVVLLVTLWRYRYIVEVLKVSLPPLIINKILSYLPELWKDEEEAKEFRHKSRLSMVSIFNDEVDYRFDEYSFK